MVFLRMALRNLLRNKRRTLLALCTMVFGLATLALIRGYANSIQKMQLESTVYGTTGMLQVTANGFQKNALADPFRFGFADTKELRNKLSSIPGVKSVAPRIVLSGLLALAPPISESDSLAPTPPSTPLNLIGISLREEELVSPQLFKWLTKGSFAPEGFEKGIVLHGSLANSLNLEPSAFSDADEATWPAVLANDVDGNLNGVALRPVGSLAAALPGDKRVGYVNLKQAQSLLRLEGKITSLVVQLEDLDSVPKLQRRIEKELGPEFEVTRWDELAPMVKDIVRNLDLIFVLVSLIFVFLVALGVANAVLISVMERKQEIGTILALGGTRKQIIWNFSLEGFFLGVFGGVLGTLLGTIAVVLVHRIGIHLNAPGSDVKVILRTFVGPGYLAASFALNCVLATLASWWPSRQASRLSPMEALKTA